MSEYKEDSVWVLWCRLHKQPLFKKLRTTTLILILYSIVVITAQTFFDKVFDKMQINNLGQFHLIFSFVMTILVGFRINSSYARWWEGRGYWGALVNNSRNLAFKFNNFIGLNNDPLFLKCLAIFPTLLKFHLRKQQDECIQIMNDLGLKFTPEDNLPNALVGHLYSRINYYRIEKIISLEQYLALETHLVSLIDVQGGCEKIASTPIPVPFKLFVRQSLSFYMIIFPFGWVEDFGVLIIPILLVLVYILKGLEILSEDIEEPFGENGASESNNLPLDSIAIKISQNVHAIANFER